MGLSMELQSTLINRYQIERKIGQGGMGTVYLAVDTQTNTQIAIKHLKSEVATPALIERFRREGEALRDLNHPNIVKLLDTVEADGEHYLLLEYVSGGDLADLIRNGISDHQQILRYALDLADALTRAHKLDIIHRDLKPGNILIAEDSTLRLTDFGIAQLGSKERVTDTDAIVGTIDYLPPEAFDGTGIDTRSDIWAFGVILFELIAGERPFAGDTIVETIQKITTAPTPDLESLNPSAPIALIDLVYRMLERDPASRMPSVRHIGAELEDILYGRSARQPGTKRFETDSQEWTVEVQHNLPAQTTVFVGRTTDVQAVTNLLTQTDNRLVTILGPGGMGKTRLSLAVAEALLEHYRDGVFFVEFAPLSDVENIVSAIADVLGYHFQGDGREPLEQLQDFLSQKSLLLILDNFEHLLDGATLTTDLLTRAPQLNILTTTRERLNQMGETVYQLAGMEFPTWETPADALEYGSVQLFVQSAKRVHPTFELKSDNMAAVARICKLVQGMPLGILLSASWLGILTSAEVAEEIAGGIDFLETNVQDIPERQRSIRAVFDYSWTHMTEAEQNVFMKLSVFRDGFTREAAQAVADAALRVLMTLMNKSLIRRDNQTGRYEIHELLRQYGYEKLVNASLDYETHDKHSNYFVDMLSPHTQITLTASVIKQLDTEFENIQVAMRNCADFMKIEAIHRALDAFVWFMDYRTRYLDAVSILKYMIVVLEDKLQSTMDTMVFGHLKSKLGWFYNSLGRSADGIPLGEQAIQIARSLDDLEGIGYALHTLCICYIFSAKFEEIIELTTTFITYYDERQAEDKYYEAVYYWAGNAHIYLGNHELAIQFGHKLSQLANINILLSYNVLGQAYELSGDYETAKSYLLQCLQGMEKAGWAWGIALMNQLLGNIAVRQNDLAQAERYGKIAYLTEYERDSSVDLYAIILGAPTLLTLRGDKNFALRIISWIHHYELVRQSHSGETSTRPLMNQTLEKLKTEMESDKFQNIWDEGKSLTFDQVKQELYDYFSMMEIDD